MVLRRPLQGEVLLSDEQQRILAFVETKVPAKGYEYAVLVTDLPRHAPSHSCTETAAMRRMPSMS